MKNKEAEKAQSNKKQDADYSTPKIKKLGNLRKITSFSGV